MRNDVVYICCHSPSNRAVATVVLRDIIFKVIYLKCSYVGNDESQQTMQKYIHRFWYFLSKMAILRCYAGVYIQEDTTRRLDGFPNYKQFVLWKLITYRLNHILFFSQQYKNVVVYASNSLMRCNGRLPIPEIKDLTELLAYLHTLLNYLHTFPIRFHLND